MNFDDLKNPELQEKLKAAKTLDELFEIVKAEGYELSDDALGSVSAGWCPLRLQRFGVPDPQLHSLLDVQACGRSARKRVH